MSKIYRDGVEHTLDSGSRVKSRTTPDGHVIESWLSKGKKVFFANLAGSVYCAHGDSEAQAIGDAVWKNPALRPSMDSLVAEIRPIVKTRKITVREFQLLTGACTSGCTHFLSENNLASDTSMTLADFLPIGGDWARKLAQVLS